MFKFILGTLLSLVTAVAFAAVDINKAGQADLESIKGIGPSMSTRILDARKAGPFTDWADLRSRVKGVGEGNAAKFSADGLTVNGAAYTASAEKASAKGTKAKQDKPASRRHAKAAAMAGQ